MCKGARITHLHLCCTINQHFTTTNSISTASEVTTEGGIEMRLLLLLLLTF